MNLFTKFNYIAKALVKSNPKTALSTAKTVYLLYGWQGVKNAIINKDRGNPIVLSQGQKENFVS